MMHPYFTNVLRNVYWLKYILYNKNVDIKISKRVSEITFIKYALYRNIEKPNNIKVFGSKKAKWPKQDSQNRLWSPMREGGKS